MYEALIGPGGEVGAALGTFGWVAGVVVTICSEFVSKEFASIPGCRELGFCGASVAETILKVHRPQT